MAEAIDILRNSGLLSPQSHEEICKSGEFGVWRVLLALEAGLDPNAVAEVLAKEFDAPRLQVLTPWPSAGTLASEKLVKLRYCAPIRDLEDGTIVLAMVDPSDRASIDDIRIVTGREVIPMTVTVEQIELLWNLIYPNRKDYRELIASIYTSLQDGTESEADRLLNLLILASSEDASQLDLDWSGDEVDITGLCHSSTRDLDRTLAARFTEALRVMTRTPEPANLGGLLVHVSGNRAPRHFLVRFSADTTTIMPVDASSYSEFFG